MSLKSPWGLCEFHWEHLKVPQAMAQIQDLVQLPSNACKITQVSPFLPTDCSSLATKL